MTPVMFQRMGFNATVTRRINFLDLELRRKAKVGVERFHGECGIRMIT